MQILLKMYSLLDSKLPAFNPPQFFNSHGEAERWLVDLANNVSDKNMVFKHPEDFSLHYVGDYDIKTGVVVPVTPQCIVNATACVKTKQ